MDYRGSLKGNSQPKNRAIEKKPKLDEDKLFIVFITIIALLAGTHLHEILHYLVALFFGWSISSFNAGWLTGQTNVEASVQNITQIPTFSLWFFFMLPATIIYTMTFLAVVWKPTKTVLIVANILMFLNLASLDPEITSSDSYEAARLLSQRGMGDLTGFAVQYLIFFAIIAVWALFQYVAIENNLKDAQKRLQNLNPLKP